MTDALIHTRLPDRAPPISEAGIIYWARANLFSSVTNTLMTLFSLYALYMLVPPLVNWGLVNANLAGTDRTGCDANEHGACWTFIKVRFNQIMYGLFYGSHPDQIWRPILAFFSLVALIIPLFMDSFNHKGKLSAFVLIVFPFIAFALIHGGWLGLPIAETSEWGGFLLTFVLASVGIVAALPIGILLALGRRSDLPIVRGIFGFLYRVMARYAADYRVVHGVRFAAIVLPRWRRFRQSAAGADRHHLVPVGLCRRSHQGRLASHSQRPV